MIRIFDYLVPIAMITIDVTERGTHEIICVEDSTRKQLEKFRLIGSDVLVRVPAQRTMFFDEYEFFERWR